MVTTRKKYPLAREHDIASQLLESANVYKDLGLFTARDLS